jgi:hypothetical protein
MESSVAGIEVQKVGEKRIVSQSIDAQSPIIKMLGRKDRLYCLCILFVNVIWVKDTTFSCSVRYLTAPWMLPWRTFWWKVFASAHAWLSLAWKSGELPWIVEYLLSTW